MKYPFFMLAFILPFVVSAQKEEYKASNGRIYHVGDTITLSKGSGMNGVFTSFQVAGLARSTVPEQNYMPASMVGIKLIIKKIKNWPVAGQDRFYFVTQGHSAISNGWLFIEQAIGSCEITDCNKPENKKEAKQDKFEQLKKLKELLDSGAITQEEFDKEKKKILEGN